MKVILIFVPPDGGERDYSLEFEMPSVPQKGDYISITRPKQQGTSDFIVRRTWWRLNYPDDDSSVGSVDDIFVECEFALSPFSSESHKISVEMYKSRKGKLLKFDDTMY